LFKHDTMQVLPSTASEDKYDLFNKRHELSEWNATDHLMTISV